MTSITVNSSILGSQLIGSRVLREERSRRGFGQLLPAVLVFSVLAMQLWVRLEITERGYEIEQVRKHILQNDAELRQERLQYAYLTRPQALTNAAERRLGLAPLLPQFVRKVKAVEGEG